MKHFEGILFILLILYNSAIRCSARDLTLNVNLKKPIAVTDERFLSLTVDPVTLLTGNALSNDFEKSVNLAKALSPAYVRLGGPSSSLYSFAGRGAQDAKGNKGIVLSESDLALINQWAKKAGLDVVSCVSPDIGLGYPEDFQGAREIVSFSDHMNFNTNWQLGYECQTKCNISATNVAKQTASLRKILDEFPRFSNSMLIGPDIAAYSSEKEQKYLREYFDIAAPVVSAITWHPDFASVTSGERGVYIQQDNLEKDREELLKVIGRYVKNQPLWIAESKAEEYKNLYIGALILARRLGNAAKLNVNVVMRQPTDLTQPTPDYWVSLLHKNLIGREVFDTKIHASDKNHVYLYCQCAKSSERYKKGSVVMFGVNLSPESVSINFKGTKIVTVDRYMLSPGMDTPNRMFARTVLLNNESLSLVNDTVPRIQPTILYDPNGLNLELPSGGIGFWVFPDVKIKPCMENVWTSKKERSPEVRLAGDSNGAEDTKILVTRSVQDRVDRLREKRKQKNGHRVSRIFNLRTEIRRLTDYVRRRLEDYRAKSLLKMSEIADSKEENVENRRSAYASMAQQYQDDMRAKLKDFEDRLSRVKSMKASDEAKPATKNPLEALIDDVTSLMSRIQTALVLAKNQSNFEERIKSANTVQDHLKSLYELLTQAKLSDLPDNKEETTVEQSSGRSKRSLFETPFDEDSEESGFYRKVKHRMVDAGGKVRPSVIGQRTSDSGENTFYGFFKTKPMEGFPEGDVPFATEDYPEDRDDERVWSEDEADYPFYEPVEFAGKSRLPNNPTGINSDTTELWEAQSYGPRTNDRSYYEDVPSARNWQIQRDNDKWGVLNHRHAPSAFLNSDENVPKPEQFKPERAMYAKRSGSKLGRKLTDRGTILSDYGLNSDLKGLDFSLSGGSYGGRRVKRESKDLRDILEQEMIKEDDANSKDCNCRVVRHPKSSGYRSERATAKVAQKPATRLIPITEIQMPVVVDPEVERENLREAEDVEVFAKVSGPPMQRQDAEIETSTPKLKRYIMPIAQTESYLQSFQHGPIHADMIEAYTESNIPILETHSEYARNHKDFHSDMLAMNPSSPLNLQNPQDAGLPPRPSVQPDESRFFREEPETFEEETKIDIAEPASNDEKSDTPFTGEKVTNTEQEAKEAAEEAKDAEKAEEIGEEEMQGTEISSTTLKTATLSDETATEGPKNDYNGDDEELGSKRDVVESRGPAKKLGRVAAAKPRSRIETRQRAKPATQSGSSTAKSRESELSKRVRALKALRELMRAFRQGQPTSQTPKLKATNKADPPAKDRTVRAHKLSNVQAKKSATLRRSRDESTNVTDPTEDRQARNLNRRQVLDDIENGGDIKDMADYDSLDCALTHRSADYDVKPEESKIEESVEKIRVPVIEMVRARNVRERIFDPANQPRLRKSTVMEHPNPKRLTERKLTSLPDNVATEEDTADADRKGQDKSYFALVEDLDSPRIFYYREKPESKEKRSAQASPSPRSFFYAPGYTNNRPGQRIYERQGLKAAQYSSEEDQEESDKLPGDKEIYIIDPSEYKGGDPPLRLYTGPARSRSSVVDSYEIVWEPIVYKTYKMRGSDQRKREDTPSSQRDEELSKKAEELLKTVLEDLDSETLQKLYDQMKKHTSTNAPKQNFMRSIPEDAEEISSRKNATWSMPDNEDAKKNFKSEEIANRGGEFSEMTDAPFAREQTQVPRVDTLEQDETQMKEDDPIFEAEIVPESVMDNGSQEEDPYEIEQPHIRAKRDANVWSEVTNFEWLPSYVIRKVPRAIQKTSQNNYIYLKGNSEKMVDENSSELYKILKGSDIYKAIPVKTMYDKSTSSDEYSSIEEMDRILGTGDSYRKLSDSSVESEEGTSNLAKDAENISSEYSAENTSNVQELCNTSEEDVRNDEKSNENAKLKDLLSSLEQSDASMMLPLTKENGRYRRDTADQARVSEINNTERVQLVEYQHLDESVVSKVSTFGPIDDIEKSLIQKIPLEKFTAKENVNKRRNMRKNKKANELPALIEQSIPKLGNVVVNGLKRAENFTGSVENLIENLDERYNETLNWDQQRSGMDTKSGVARNAFHSAITNVKKFFVLLSGITHLIRA